MPGKGSAARASVWRTRFPRLISHTDVGPGVDIVLGEPFGKVADGDGASVTGAEFDLVLAESPRLRRVDGWANEVSQR